MEGFNPIRQSITETTPSDPEPLTKSIKSAVSMVASAMREGMLDQEDVTLLEAGGIRKTEARQSAYKTFNDLLGMAQAIKAKVIDGDVVQIQDSAELAKLVGVVVKLMDMVRKSMSEARRNEELTSLESVLHECISDIQESAEGNPEFEKAVEAAMKTMMSNLEDRLRQIQAKYEE